MARCFCHLHLHTHYSMLDGFNRIEPLVAQCKKLGMNSCAITDHGNLYGAIEFYMECKKGGIKPVIGYEAYLAPGPRTDRDGKGELGHATHLTLLAKNATGFKNLIKMSSAAYLEGFYRHPRIDRQLLEAHKDGIIVLSGCLAGEFNQYIAKGKPQEAEKSAKWFRKVFGENYYIEIQNNGIGLQDECTPVAADISQKLGVPLVATADAHYLCSEDARAHDVLFCINTRQMHDQKKKKYPEERMPNPYFVRSPDDMYKLFPNYADAVARSQEIADGVDIEIDFKKRYFPVFDTPEAKTPAEYLRELCLRGVAERYGDSPSEAVMKRLDHELGVITKMGFETYFLVVWDFVRFAREQGIPCTARGSGCGAIVAYVLYMSHVCPLEYDLLFERFLDPNRSEAPDIDIDFCQDRRELVIDYVKRKYGEASVAQIGTFGTLAAKAALKDVGRVLDVPLERVNFMCKLVPMKGAIAKSLQEALDESPDFRREYDQDPQIHELVDLALKLEGTNRNVGTHAAGVVIANGPITNYVPVQRPPKKGGEESPNAATTMTTQWEMGIIEKVGLLKMDFLGLRNLTVLDNCVKLIKKTRGETIDPMKFSLDDKLTYELLQRGDAKGVFQLESEGIRELLKRMKPDNIRDLIAVLALYRPGPLEGGMVDEYVECKHGRKKPVYQHPVMEEVLSETYGVMVYQEGLMRILNRLGGIELAKAYACIKAISKKKMDIIEERKADFVKGAEERGLSAEKATEIFELIVKFGSYGFNKCLTSDAKVADALTGEIATVGDLFERRRTFTACALGASEKIGPRAVTDVVWNGRKRVYRLTTELGKSICATTNHPFRTLDGWTNLGDLKPGDRIAAPRRLTSPTTESWPRHELIALAGLLSEGNTCHPTTLYFYSNDRRMIDDFAGAIGQFSDTVAKVYARAGGRRLEVQANTGRDTRFKPKSERDTGTTAVLALPTRSGAFRWAERLGILGKKATTKFVPTAVFRLCDADIELFLGRLWAGDGFIATDTFKVPFYATSSRQLAEDVQHLLLRLGIVSRIHEKQFKYKGGFKPGFTVHAIGAGAVDTFLARLAPHCIGRERAVALLREHAATTRGRSNKDTIPIQVRALVDDARRRAGLTWDELAAKAEVDVRRFARGNSEDNYGFRRDTIAKLATFLGSQRLIDLATSDVYWDRVVSVEYVGVEDTYDLTVEEDHNFVANGLIVHNSHTAAYAQIGYQTAFLKAHYTAEYMAALLSSEIDDGNKRDVFIDHISDARKLGVDVLPPDVNRGLADFDVQNNRIIFGLTAIKGLGRGAAQDIVRARTEGGKFTDVFDFCERIDRRIVPKAAVEKMIQAGAFDLFGRRSSQFAAVTKAYASADERAAEKRRGQGGLFDDMEGEDAGSAANLGLPDVPEWPETERLKFEKEALDFYITSHPLAQHDEQLRRYRTHDAGPLAKNGKNGTEARIGGMITNLDVRTANKGRNIGRKYAMFRIEDFTGSVRCIMWSDEYSRWKEVVTSDLVAVFEGVLNWGEGRAEPDYNIKKIITIDEARTEFTKSMVLKLAYAEDDESLRKLDAVSIILKRYKGGCPVYLSVRDTNGKQVQMKLSEEFRVNPAALKLEELEMLLGPGAVIFSR